MWNEMSYNYYSHKNNSDRIRCEENDERQGMYRCCDCGIYMTFEEGIVTGKQIGRAHV